MPLVMTCNGLKQVNDLGNLAVENMKRNVDFHKIDTISRIL